MNKMIADIEKKLNRLTKRDRWAVFAITVVVVLMLWDALLFRPLSEQAVVVEQDIQQAQTQITDIKVKMDALQNRMQEDPDAHNREMLDKYMEESKRLDHALAKTSVQVIDPRDMAKMLERILKEQTELKFISLENREATPEFIEAEVESGTETEQGEAAGSLGTIYRHSVVIEMEGSYHNMLSYLKKLEQLPWRFFWQGIEIETKKYPTAFITLEVYTLGFREGLLGV